MFEFSSLFVLFVKQMIFRKSAIVEIGSSLWTLVRSELAYLPLVQIDSGISSQDGSMMLSESHDCGNKKTHRIMYMLESHLYF